MQFLPKPPGLKSQQGFSLVELMVVVSIIAILSTMAYPRFRVFQAKARQTEARVNLTHIYTLQQSFWADRDGFFPDGGGTFGPYGLNQGQCGDNLRDNELGFVLENCLTSRYAYSIANNAGDATFRAIGVSGVGPQNRVLTGCTGADAWDINQDRAITPVNDITRGRCNNGQVPGL